MGLRRQVCDQARPKEPTAYPFRRVGGERRTGLPLLEHLALLDARADLGKRVCEVVRGRVAL